MSVLFHCLRSGRIHLIDHVLLGDCDVDQRDEDGNAALHIGCHDGSLSAVRVLLECGADYNLEDRFGRTPLEVLLIFNAFGGKCEPTYAIGKMLFSYGASPFVIDRRDRYPDRNFSSCFAKQFPEEMRSAWMRKIANRVVQMWAPTTSVFRRLDSELMILMLGLLYPTNTLTRGELTEVLTVVKDTPKVGAWMRYKATRDAQKRVNI